ncbi:LysR substrate-binding domain-containing protein [Escherichia coli]
MANRRLRLQLQGTLPSNNLRVMLQAVLGGNGVVLLPQFACKQGLVNGELVRLFSPWSGIPRPLYAYSAGRKGMPAIARYFMDELTTRLANGV